MLFRSNKSIIKNLTADFISNSYKQASLKKLTTSGSTGAPLTVWHDNGKRIRHVAENIFFSERAGLKFGMRLYYLRIWNEINKKSLFTRTAQNVVMVDTSNLSSEYINRFLVQLASDKSEKSLLGYSSSLECLASHVSAMKTEYSFGVKCIIAISEMLPDGSKRILERFFNCPVIARYSNIENGFLAQQCGNASAEYHINVASFHIELLHPEKDIAVKNEEIGRVVVTDLFNFGMPIIRYDTGDMAKISGRSDCGSPGAVFKQVEGRKVDFIFDTKGNMLSPHSITNTMWKYSSEIRQFQFIQQTSSDYEIKLNALSRNSSMEFELVNDLKSYIGNDAQIKVIYESDIPVLASGKRRKIVNNYKKS